MKKETEFKVGDVVEAFGVEGKVISVSEGLNLPIVVRFHELCPVPKAFMLNGKEFTWHKIPDLKLISRKKVTKRYWLWDIKSKYNNIFKDVYYRDEEGKSFGGVDISLDTGEILDRKHENEFRDEEV